MVGTALDLRRELRALEFIAENGRELTGKHHEIYPGHPRRGRPDRLRTLVRQPVA